MSENAVSTLGAIGLLAIACQWLAWWAKLPAILFLLLAGIVAGPVTGWLNPEALFGDLLFPFVSLSVAIILFEGALTLRIYEIRGLERVVRNLVTIGILVTSLITAIATHWALGFSWELSFLFGAITVVTGPTVIAPMLRTVRPNAKVANILRWEGIVIDPIGALLAVLVYEFIISGQGAEAMGATAASFGRIILAGLFLGAAAGYTLGVALRRHALPEYLHNVATLTLVCGVFAASNAIQAESGLLAVTVMGMWFANMKDTPVEDILDFKESLSVLLISVLFIVLAARVEFSDLMTLGWPALWIFLIMQFIARPAKALISTMGSSLNWREKALLGWIAPRGIVAAAVSALFAERLELAGFDNASLLAPLTFIVIIGTVSLQSATAGALAKWLKVAEPDPKGFLIIGANAVARAIAKALSEKGFRALLTDTSWENISKARMEGLPTYYGNPVSEHADRRLDLVGIGRMLGLSPHAELNIIASMKYMHEFGRNSVYTIQTSAEKKAPEKHRPAAWHKGYTLFGDNVTYSMLASLLSQGGEIRSTKLSGDFQFEEYKNKYQDNVIPLFALDTRGRIGVFVAGGKMKPEAGWVIISLVRGGTEEKGKGKAKEASEKAERSEK